MRMAVLLTSCLLCMLIMSSANGLDCNGHLCIANQPINEDQNNLLKLELINPSEIKNGQPIGEYVILTPEDIQNIAVSLSNGATIKGPILIHSEEITVSEGGEFYQKWKELQGQLEDTQFAADIIALLIVGGSPSEFGIKVSEYVFNKNSPVTIKEPPELASLVGDLILNVAQEKNDQLFAEILKTYGVNGAIVISPGTSLILEIPVKASTINGKASLDLSIPYRYYTMNQPMTGKPLVDQLRLIQAGQRKYCGQYFGIKDMQEIKETFKASVEIQLTPSAPEYQLYWGFDRDLDGWERTGSVPPWHTMDSGIKWYDQWGGSQGVIVIDACESTPSGYEAVHAKGGIRKIINLPQNMNNVIFNVVRENHDGGIRFLLTDSEGQHTLGEELLSGTVTKQLSYDISAWRGKTITLEVQTFGAGTDDSGCVGSSHGWGSCCWEYVGIDSVTITGDYS